MTQNLIKSCNEERLIALTKEHIINSLTPRTRDKYVKNIQMFKNWCDHYRFKYLPADPETVAKFLSYEAAGGKKVNTLKHRLIAIKILHESNGYLSPTYHKGVQSVFSGIKRKYGVAVVKKSPITIEKLEKMIAHCKDNIMGVRDKALLVIGFCGAFRRSELTNIKLEDIEPTPEGLKITLHRSKTDQCGQGQTVAILNGDRLKALDVLHYWITYSGIESGYIFRSVTKSGIIKDCPLPAGTISLLVKKYAALAGLEDIDSLGGHSLRAGFITSAAQNGAGVGKIMEVSRHKRIDTLMGYVREAKLFNNHAGRKFL